MNNIYSDEDNIKELTFEDFNQKPLTLKKKFCLLNSLIIVYAPWCSHCVITKEMWINLSNIFKYKFNIYSLNTYNYDNNNQKLVKPLDISIYPSYFYVNKEGILKKYEGKRSENDFIEFILKHLD